MNIRQNANAILHYQSYDKMPVVHFGFWQETLIKWAEEGHISMDEALNWQDCSIENASIGKKLGFDFNWGTIYSPNCVFDPPFPYTVLEEHDDGSMKVLNEEGVIVMIKKGVVSIPTEVDHYFKGRKEWEELFKPKLQFNTTRVESGMVPAGNRLLRFDPDGSQYLQDTPERETPLGLYSGSLFGFIRNFVGIENVSYLTVDEPELLKEMIDTVAHLCHANTKAVLETGAQFDYIHFWEDICFNSGPLVNPVLFRELVAPHYKKITSLAKTHGIDIVSVDCDGKIDLLLPIWLESGVNTMFPIEVGTWKASIAPWRTQYGKELRGVGGMDKTVFAKDKAAIKQEVERLKPLVGSGGYIPCPDHRIAPDAKWENVQYYCELMHKSF